MYHTGPTQAPPISTMNQSPMTPMMPNPNLQQAGQMMIQDPNGKYNRPVQLLSRLE